MPRDREKMIKYNNTYNQQNYDRVSLMLPKGQKEAVREHAEAMGESLNAFVNRAIREAMERDKGAKAP
ncbi:MAG: hypothetical protein LUE89_09155 [Clostridiales bacterium]|nr:hypothetical protein [Clostridiales bacterium]